MSSQGGAGRRHGLTGEAALKILKGQSQTFYGDVDVDVDVCVCVCVCVCVGEWGRQAQLPPQP
jgi:hypothetical protein